MTDTPLTSSQNCRSLAPTFTDLGCFEDISTKDEAICRAAPATPSLSIIKIPEIYLEGPTLCDIYVYCSAHISMNFPFT